MFDPYDKWLGIPKGQRPVDYFLLLDLDPEERDPKVIRAAAGRQAAQVSAHEDGPHAQACARLLKEIDQARVTLLNPAKRKEYEAQLRKTSAGKRGPAGEEEEDGPARRPGGKGKNKGAAKSPRKPRPSHETGRVWLWAALGGGAALLLLLAGGVTFWLTRPKKADAPAPAGPVAAAAQPVPVVAPPEPPPQAAPPAPPPPVQPPTPPPPKPTPPAPLSRPPAAKPARKVSKLPVPDQAAQAKAEKAIKAAYKADYGKGKPEENLALAAKLLQPGRENRADPAAWFVLLREARDAAVRAGKPRLAVETVDEIDRWFVIDAFAMKLQALAAVGASADEGASRAVTKTALDQVEEALTADNYEAGLRLADAAEAAARNGKGKGKPDDKQIALARSRRGEVEVFQKAYRAFVAAREKLRQAPADPDANLVVGKHLCLFQGRWDEGLPLLGQGTGETAALARQDLTPPADLKAQIAAGDGWWQLSGDQAGRVQRHLRERAVAWYELAVAKVTGVDQARLVGRIGAVEVAAAGHIKRLVPGSFFGRDVEDRILLLREGGGTMRSEEAVERGLDWLSRHQAREGNWATHAFHLAGRCTCADPGQQHDIAGTAFGLLPFLGVGQTHKQGRYRGTVLRGLVYLLSQQKQEGKFSDNAYENAMATIAVCEAYGLTRDKRLLFVPAQAAVNFIVGAQHGGGSWGYSPGQKGDTSVSGWQFSALKAGYYAGLSVPAATFARVGGFLNEVADPNGLGYGYNTPGAGRATSATGLLCREYLGWGPRHPIVAKGVGQLLLPQNFVTEEKPGLYFIFYATQTMHHAGGEAWETWNLKVRDLLVETQDQGQEAGREHQQGSWSPRGDDYAKEGGRLMSTSLALLTLEVYYYHIPIYGYGPTVRRD